MTSVNAVESVQSTERDLSQYNFPHGLWKRFEFTLALVLPLISASCLTKKNMTDSDQHLPQISAEAPVHYPLSGGGDVAVFSPYGKEVYAAVATINGYYPEDNCWAKDVRRNEYLFVTEGKLEVKLNDCEVTLNSGDHLLIRDGDYYQIRGYGKVSVLVYDLTDAKTEILKDRLKE